MGTGYTFSGTCKGTTKAGKRCGHIVVFANGRCRQHGGDSAAFMAERMAKIKAKALRRLAKWKKRIEAFRRGRTP